MSEEVARFPRRVVQRSGYHQAETCFAPCGTHHDGVEQPPPTVEIDRHLTTPTKPTTLTEGHLMRLARVAHPDGMAFAVIDGPPEDARAREIADHPFGNPTFTGRSWSVDEVRFLAPILPSKIIGIGRNYIEHANELGNPIPDEPVIFLKPSTSVIGPGVPIMLPAVSNRVDFEGELVAVIGRPCRDVRAEDASGVILGYTVGNDVTARDLRKPNGPWLRGKGYDTFCPLGPWIETDLDPSALAVRTEVNSEVKQDGSTEDMIFTVGELIEFCSQVMTLLPGDVIMTGTPEGVGPLVAGDTVSVTVTGIGTLANPVATR
jgi:2-keto-4-pentenoate hydratase/2-oxohepta-3-ene-1,7-dioic acid hydratase in catechol pathway